MAYEPRCPRCGSERMQYVKARVRIRGRHSRTYAGWWACLDCWAKSFGATDDPNGILPVGVRRIDDDDG